MTDYLEVVIELHPFEPWADVLAHELGLLGYESFSQEDPMLKAYIPQQGYQEAELQLLLHEFKAEVTAQFQTSVIPARNWNEEWESNFHPVRINEHVSVRAPFHDPVEGAKYDLVIHPKMAFGTGHHPTTSMMMDGMLDLEMNNQTVLDVGTGTGILAILAEKLGAKDILAFDHDDWSVLNAAENVKLNDCHRITVEKQTIQDVVGKPVNVILANINRNVILADLAAYADLLEPAGHLLLSGFMTVDTDHIIQAAEKLHLMEVSRKKTGEWCMLHLKHSKK